MTGGELNHMDVTTFAHDGQVCVDDLLPGPEFDEFVDEALKGYREYRFLLKRAHAASRRLGYPPQYLVESGDADLHTGAWRAVRQSELAAHETISGRIIEYDISRVAVIDDDMRHLGHVEAATVASVILSIDGTPMPEDDPPGEGVMDQRRAEIFARRKADEATAADRVILRALQLDALGVLPDGNVRVHGGFANIWDTIEPSRLTVPRLLQICGQPGREHLNRGDEEIPDAWTISQIRDAIGHVAGYRQLKSIPEQLAEAAMESEAFASDGATLHVYRGGCYRRAGAAEVAEALKPECERQHVARTPKLVAEVAEYIARDCRRLWERPSMDVLNLKNGLLRLADRKLLSHSPDYLSTVQLPVAYDPDATCPAIDAFALESFPDDAIRLAFELPAWLMRPDTSIQKAVLLYGPGGGGKSIYLSLLTAFLGRTNVANKSLHKLEADRFAAAQLVGKLANVCADLPTEHLGGTSTFKAITGGDEISSEFKHRDSFDWTPFARLVFSANALPRSTDSSQGFFDRWLVLPFSKVFRGTDREIPRHELLAELTTPRELSGLLNRALDSLATMTLHGGLSQPESVLEAFREFQAVTDPLGRWLDQYTVDDPDGKIERKSLRVAFAAAMEREGRPPMTEQEFGRRFKRLRPAVQERQRTTIAGRRWFYIGIELNDARAAQDAQDISHSSFAGAGEE